MKKILYIDMDNVLVDFKSGIARLTKAEADKVREALPKPPQTKQGEETIAKQIYECIWQRGAV